MRPFSTYYGLLLSRQFRLAVHTMPHAADFLVFQLISMKYREISSHVAKHTATQYRISRPRGSSPTQEFPRQCTRIKSSSFGKHLRVIFFKPALYTEMKLLNLIFSTNLIL